MLAATSTIKCKTNISFSTSPSSQPVRKMRRLACFNIDRQKFLCGKTRQKFTGKELDPETGLYYYGARYLDPRISRWLSGDPAMGEYIPILTAVKINLPKIFTDADEAGIPREAALMWTIAHEISHCIDLLDMGFDNFWNDMNSGGTDWHTHPAEQRAEAFALRVFNEIY